MSSLLLIPLMAFLARASGGGVGAHHLDRFKATWLPEAIFALCIGLAAGHEFGWWWTLTAIWSYLAMQAGHGTFYQMNGWESSNPDRIQKIEYIIRPVFKLFNWSIYRPSYSWACMGLKGLAIGLPLFPYGLLLAVLWPLAYTRGTVSGEYLSGAFTGLCLVLWLSV